MWGGGWRCLAADVNLPDIGLVTNKNTLVPQIEFQHTDKVIIIFFSFPVLVHMIATSINKIMKKKI